MKIKDPSLMEIVDKKRIKLNDVYHYVIWFSVFIIALMIEPEIYSFEKRSQPLSLTTSVVIPCHPLHVHFLRTLLEDYAQQTVLPEEIVISISEKHRVNEEEIQALRQSHWPFHLIINLSSQRLFPGANRNIACALASGDIYIFQDADDIPHKQRIEIIKHFFSCYKINHLMHSYKGGSGNFEIEKYNPESINFYRLTDAGQAFHFPFPVHFGQCAISRRSFNKVKWEEQICVGEDINLCNNMIRNFKFSLLIDAKILLANTSFLPDKVRRGVEYD